MRHDCAIKEDHSFTCWDHNNDGQVSELEFTDVMVTELGGCATKKSGGSICWGQDANDLKELRAQFAGRRTAPLVIIAASLILVHYVWATFLANHLHAPPPVPAPAAPMTWKAFLHLD